MRIRKDDIVKVTVGDDKDQTGKVLSINHAENKLIVEGVNRVFKHVRRSQRNPQGGRLSKEMPIPVSNVILICPRCNMPARVGARYADDGAKERFCKKCGGTISQMSPPRPQYAKK